MPVEPIKPEEVAGEKLKQLPDEVVEAFNELIAQNWNGHQSVVLQKDAIELIIEKMALDPRKKPQIRQAIFAEHWLDVEDIYREEGWTVEFDKPDLTYNASYTFNR